MPAVAPAGSRTISYHNIIFITCSVSDRPVLLLREDGHRSILSETSAHSSLISAFGIDAAPEYSGPVNAISTAGMYDRMAVGPVDVELIGGRIDVGTAILAPITLICGLIVGVTRTTVVDAVS